MLNIMLVGLSWFLSTAGQNLSGPYALQLEPGLYLVAGQVIHSLLGAYGSVAPHWLLSAVPCLSCEEYCKAWAHRSIHHYTGGSSCAITVTKIWYPRTHMETKGIISHLLWWPGGVCADCVFFLYATLKLIIVFQFLSWSTEIMSCAQPPKATKYWFLPLK